MVYSFTNVKTPPIYSAYRVGSIVKISVLIDNKPTYRYVKITTKTPKILTGSIVQQQQDIPTYNITESMYRCGHCCYDLCCSCAENDSYLCKSCKRPMVYISLSSFTYSTCRGNHVVPSNTILPIGTSLQIPRTCIESVHQQ